MVSSKVGPESFNYFWQTMELEKLMEFFTTKLLSCHWHYFKIIKSGKSEKRQNTRLGHFLDGVRVAKRAFQLKKMLKNAFPDFPSRDSVCGSECGKCTSHRDFKGLPPGLKMSGYKVFIFQKIKCYSVTAL